MGAGSIALILIGLAGTGAAVYYMSRPSNAAAGATPPQATPAPYDGYGGFSQQQQSVADNAWSFLTGLSSGLSNMLSTGYGQNGWGYSDHEESQYSPPPAYPAGWGNGDVIDIQ